MVHKLNLLDWLKAKMESFSNDCESDHVHIECSLIRALSDYREKELSSFHLDKDFNQKLMYRLDHIDLENVEPFSYKRPTNYKLPFACSLGCALVAVISLTIINTSEDTSPQFNKMPAHVTPIDLKSYSGLTTDENPLIQDLKNNPDNVKLLEKLETYYSESGKKEHATEIHSVLETVSKRY